jgi:hypothetical protein
MYFVCLITEHDTAALKHQTIAMKKALLLTGLAIMFLAVQSMAEKRRGFFDPGPIDPELINGSVKHAANNKPLKDVSVTVIEDNQGKAKTLQTDEAGAFGISSLKPGTYKFVFQKDGYRKVVREKVVVKPDTGIRFEIEMEEIPYELSPSPFHFFKH